MTKYQKLLQEYQVSGLSIKVFAAKMGKTPLYVHYHLQKAREEKPTPDQNCFVPIEVRGVDKSLIRNATSQGTIIEIPL